MDPMIGCVVLDVHMNLVDPVLGYVIVSQIFQSVRVSPAGSGLSSGQVIGERMDISQRRQLATFGGLPHACSI